MSIDFPKEEEAIIARWREINAFERQVRDDRHICSRPYATGY
jgi:hypothetical protein